MAKRKSRSKFSSVRHPFLYHLIFPANGKKIVKRAMAKVRPAKRPVTIELTADHVRKSMRLEGAGRTDVCAGAICLSDHADAFGHKVEGHLDFQYARAFLVSKLDKIGLPAECYAYEHDHADIAKLNDSHGGQQKLLDIIERDGPIQIKLKPYRRRSKQGRSGALREATGARAKSVGKGAKLRYSTLQLGGHPA